MAPSDTEERTCNECDETKPLSDFSQRQPVCKPCRATKARQWRAENRELYQESYDRMMFKRYNIDREWWDRTLEAQGHRCAICRTDDPGQRTWHVDHDHACCSVSARSCGKCVRGLLCSQCNSLLGMAKDNAATLLAAADYLARAGNVPQQQVEPVE